METRAFLDWGRWVADCPGPKCTYAQGLTIGQDRMVCRNGDGTGCGTEAEIVWPKDPEGIMADLIDKADPLQRWTPSDG